MKKIVADPWATKDQGMLVLRPARGEVTELFFLGLRLTRSEQGELLLDLSRWLKATMADLGWQALGIQWEVRRSTAGSSRQVRRNGQGGST
eukprot:4386968-Amphidinium_carterae.1